MQKNIPPINVPAKQDMQKNIIAPNKTPKNIESGNKNNQ